MNSYKYCVLDVFTTERYRGNPLSVVFTDADLDLDTYENIAREFGYSETSFIHYSRPDRALKIRSFTPTGFEVHGAGHNLLGAVCAALLNNMEIFHEQKGKHFVIMKDEPIFLSISYPEKNMPFIGMMQRAANIGVSIDRQLIAPAIQLSHDEMFTGDLSPTVVTTEVTHLMVPVKNTEALNKAVPDKLILHTLATEYEFEGVYCFAILNRDPEYIAQARFFNPGIGIEEDAATGSAAGPLAGFLFQNRYIRENDEYKILQGVKMKQPSVIKIEVKKEGIEVSGSSVIVMEGTLYA